MATATTEKQPMKHGPGRWSSRRGDMPRPSADQRPGTGPGGKEKRRWWLKPVRRGQKQ